MVTAAELQQFHCKGCDRLFKDFIRYQCADCEKKFWYEVTLNPKWFPKQLEDGTPDWNSVEKDITIFSNKWEHGRLNIETMEMEKVPIDREGEKWDYSNYKLKGDEQEEQYLEIVRGIAMQRGKPTKKEEKQKEKEEKKEQKEVMKLIDKK